MNAFACFSTNFLVFSAASFSKFIALASLFNCSLFDRLEARGSGRRTQSLNRHNTENGMIDGTLHGIIERLESRGSGRRIGQQNWLESRGSGRRVSQWIDHLESRGSGRRIHPIVVAV